MAKSVPWLRRSRKVTVNNNERTHIKVPKMTVNPNHSPEILKIDSAGKIGLSHKDKRNSIAEKIQKASIAVKSTNDRFTAFPGESPITMSAKEVVIIMDMIKAKKSIQNSVGMRYLLFLSILCLPLISKPAI